MHNKVLHITVDCSFDPILNSILKEARQFKSFGKNVASLSERDAAVVVIVAERLKIIVHPSDELLELFYKHMENKS